MDTEYDFLLPEFFNILFFQQKSVVIFPYVDIKHLKVLEIFLEYYSIIDIDATALHNISTIINHESYNSYSIKPILYFILNANLNIIKELMEPPKIHCIINTSDNAEPLVQNDEFIFYNKKTKSFLNYTPKSQDLSYETELLQDSKNKQSLLQKLREVQAIAVQIYDSLSENGSEKEIIKILEKYDPPIWKKILQYTEKYYKIEIPKISIPTPTEPLTKKKRQLKDFSQEYQQILKQNKKIAQEFIQALHNYRERKVNPANLEIEQLFYPEKLYTYLRNHHWEHGIPQEFTDEWVLMKNTGHILTENDLLDFQILFQELGLTFNINIVSNHQDSTIKPLTNDRKNRIVKKAEPIADVIPSVQNFPEFKKWVLMKVEALEKKVKLDYGK